MAEGKQSGKFGNQIEFIEVEPSFLGKCLGAIFGGIVTAVTVPLIENPLTQIFNLMRSDITFGTMLKNILLWPFSPFLGLVHGGRAGAKKGLMEGLFAGTDAIPFFINYKGIQERTTGVALGSTLLFSAVTGIVLSIVLTAYLDPASLISFMPEVVKVVQQWFGEALANFIGGLDYIGLAAVAGATTLFAGSLIMLIGIHGANVGEKDLNEVWSRSHRPSSLQALDQPQVHDISDFAGSFHRVFSCSESENNDEKISQSKKTVVPPTSIQV